MTKLNRIDKYLDRELWEVKENSNMGYSLQGLNMFITENEISKYWMDEVYPEDIKEAHESGDFHIHDRGSLSPYCTGWDLVDLLRVGFTGVKGKTQSRAARHLRVAFLHIVNFLYSLQNETAGAVAFSNVDTLLAPFIKEDKLTYEELRQNMQEFIFNLNIDTRQGGQATFSNFSFDLTVPDHLKDLPAIVGGEAMDYTYGSLQKEVDMFNKAFAETMIEGDGGGYPFTFPIPTFSLTKDFDWDNENYLPIWELTSKFGTPTFSNFMNSDLDPEDVRSFCCRLQLDTTELKHRGSGLFGSAPLTGSIGVVTINLPRIGHIANSEEEFFDILSGLMWKAHESLEIKREFIEEMADRGLYPYSAFYLRDVKKATGKYWANHFATVGLVGMNDAVYNLFGEDIMAEKGKQFAVDVLSFMRDFISELQKNTGNFYNLESTPAEGCSYSLAMKDSKKYDDISFYNVDIGGGSTPYYTNSTHLPASHGMHLFDMLDHQNDLQPLYTGGTVAHVFLGERSPDVLSIKNLVKTIASGYNIPYFTVTPTFSMCQTHGYIDGEELFCPECGERTEIYSRVTGYIRPISSWNDGKVAEFFERSTYSMSEEEVLTN